MRARARAFEEESGPLEARLVTGLAKIGLALKHGARREAGARGLSPTQAEILVLLRRPGGPGTPGEVAQELGVGLPTVSEALSPLVAKGLVRKGRSSTDGRSVRLALTAEGQAEAERLAGWPDFLLEGVAALSAEEQAVLLRAVVKLVRSLQEQGRISVARMCPTCRFFRPNAHPDDPERPHHCAFVDAPFGERSIRIDCPDHVPAAS
ncbi:MAG TPA: MarR family winged helix-turn-helix transcriptional regulator [Actinomycetota bacterium]|nr:MarR family winged helix-turn-helix transcriptional regulator [Actinomycetota bacterium]